MKKNLKTITLFAFFGISLLMSINIAQAIVAPTSTSISQEVIKRRCELVTSRINLLITRYNNNKQKHIERYQRTKERLIRINNVLKSRGCDTSQIETDYQKLDLMIQEFAQEYNKFIDLLKNTQNYVCGQSQGDYLKSLSQARQQLLVVRQKSLNIRIFYQSTIKKDLLNLKTQCRPLLSPTISQ